MQSDQSLIQTIGRAAQNINGKTTQRRDKQIAFIREHGITPESVVKYIADVLEGARTTVNRKLDRQRAKKLKTYLKKMFKFI